MFEVKVLSENEIALWDRFVDESPWGDILQMSGWATTKSVEGWKSIVVGVFEKDNSEKLVLGAQILYKKASILGNYGYVPHGLIFHDKERFAQALPVFTDFIKTIASKYNLFTLEIEPKIGRAVGDVELYGNLGVFVDQDIYTSYTKSKFVFTNRNMQPKYKLMYDLSKSEDELLSLCQKTTRYNIRLAQKKGVKVNVYYPEDAMLDEKLETFYQLLLTVQARTKGYPIRSKASFIRLFKSFAGTKHIALFETVYEGKTLAMNISQTTGYWASSFYAGSIREHSDTKSTYLLRWSAVMAAKAAGAKTYDFWGIVPQSDKHSGYSDHKLSFGGSRIDFVGLLALRIVPWKASLWDLGIRFRTQFKPFLRGVLWKLKGSN